MHDVFRFVRNGVDGQGRVVGRFTASGIRPRLLERLDDLGLEMPAELQAHFAEHARAVV
jgi:pilus assembly protein CpaF